MIIASVATYTAGAAESMKRKPLLVFLFSRRPRRYDGQPMNLTFSFCISTTFRSEVCLLLENGCYLLLQPLDELEVFRWRML